MKKLRVLFFFLTFTLLLLNNQLHSQSRYLESGIGGSCFKINTAIEEEELFSAGISAAYSIGGIMDIGINLVRETGKIQTYSRTDWSFNLMYNLIVIKQTSYIPFSVQLEGIYGYTNVSSEYLDINQFTRESQGYGLGISLFREFNRRSFLSLIAGAKGVYNNTLLTEMNNQIPSSPTINFNEREEIFLWGGLYAITIKPDKWPYFSLELNVLFDQTNGGMLIEPSFLITTPNF